MEVTLLRPEWLLALPALALLGWWLWTRQGGLGDWDRAMDPVLRQTLVALGRIDATPSRGPLITTLAVAGLGALALSGPAVERRDTLSYRNLDGVLFIVDSSPSVTENPRWTQLQTMGRFALGALGTRPGGLIVFGGDAYVATDMTADHLQLGQTFSLIEPGLVPDKGSRPGRALDLAADLLLDADVIAGDVVIFTDGAGLGPESLRAAERIADLGARLSLVALDSTTAQMDTHARIGGGAVLTLDHSNDLHALLSEDARTRLERQDYPLLFWHDYGRYLLLLALIPMLLLFRRETT
jgi:Ca-activated chloride channel family protein